MARGFSLFDWAGITSALVAIGGAAWWLVGKSGGKNAACSSDAVRARVVEIARSQVGQPLRPEYLADAAPDFVGQRPEWCGIFALWCLHQAGLGRDVDWKVGLGFLFKLKQTSNPLPGDIAYYDSLQHQALVARVEGETLENINGNGAGGVVSISHPDISKAKAYYSIQSWVDAFIAKGCVP